MINTQVSFVRLCAAVPALLSGSLLRSWNWNGLNRLSLPLLLTLSLATFGAKSSTARRASGITYNKVEDAGPLAVDGIEALMGSAAVGVVVVAVILVVVDAVDVMNADEADDADANADVDASISVNGVH